ncbi:secretion-regulating guanine nucleotide exchange factor [Leptonychotes weddellii]|uniref:Secretion-regulating guanine nucleotide exchange factor n=1 Tax=Leptonychotes weddellii TaxID=9713 RepID=A0A7F8Q4R4_LEPWE|nr:secretion-regulating guanine nucleotide exchange factor [Leptonychotes weddellii]
MEREPSASEAAPAAAALFAWGANSYGQLGLGHKEDVLLPQQLNDFCKPECIRRITGGGGHSAVVTGPSLAVLSNRWPVAGILPLFSQKVVKFCHVDPTPLASWGFLMALEDVWFPRPLSS